MTYYDAALEFATKAHAGQFRWDRKTPYIEHPKAVAEICKEVRKNYISITFESHIIIIALWHDILEDTTVTENDILEELNKPIYFGLSPSWIINALKCLNKHNYPEYLDLILAAKKDSFARVVKIADLTHNMSDTAKKKGSMYEKYTLAKYILERT